MAFSHMPLAKQNVLNRIFQVHHNLSNGRELIIANSKIQPMLQHVYPYTYLLGNNTELLGVYFWVNTHRAGLPRCWVMQSYAFMMAEEWKNYLNIAAFLEWLP